MGKLLIKGGRVWDGERFYYADVLTENEVISKITLNITDDADFIYDATGKTVSAGFVDAHVHISGGEFGTLPEMSTLPFGVTAAADAGIGDVRKLIDCNIRCAAFANIEIRKNHADFTQTLKTMSDCMDRVIGVKVYFDRNISEVDDITALYEAVRFAEEHGLIVMVHSSNPPVSMAELLNTLRSGDILTHAYHGGANNASDDNFDCIKNAKKSGVIIDAGMAGNVHTDFKVFEAAIKNGALPDIISTDITKFSAYKRGGRYGLPMCMSIAKHLGMKEEDIFKSVTSVPGKALKMDCGRLESGKIADIAICEYSDEGFDLTDKAGKRIFSNKGYRNILTILNGEIVYRR